MPAAATAAATVAACARGELGLWPGVLGLRPRVRGIGACRGVLPPELDASLCLCCAATGLPSAASASTPSKAGAQAPSHAGTDGDRCLAAGSTEQLLALGLPTISAPSRVGRATARSTGALVQVLIAAACRPRDGSAGLSETGMEAARWGRDRPPPAPQPGLNGALPRQCCLIQGCSSSSRAEGRLSGSLISAVRTKLAQWLPRMQRGTRNELLYGRVGRGVAGVSGRARRSICAGRSRLGVPAAHTCATRHQDVVHRHLLALVVEGRLAQQHLVRQHAHSPHVSLRERGQGNGKGAARGRLSEGLEQAGRRPFSGGSRHALWP